MNLLFDLDGTLTDPFEGITKCIAHALVMLGRPAPAPREFAVVYWAAFEEKPHGVACYR